MTLIRGLLGADFVRFCIVGAIGFVINFLLLTLFYKNLGWPPFIAQALAAEVALFNNFILHHNWTYKARTHQTVPTLLTQFHLTYWTSILGSAIIVSLGVELLNLNYIIALAVASAAAMFWNFSWTKYVIWRRTTDTELKEGLEKSS